MIPEDSLLLGEVVHNKEVVDDLFCRGLLTIDPYNYYIDQIKGKTLLARAHGLPERTIKTLQKNNNIIDMTCKNVKKIHDFVRGLDENSIVVIAGKKDHPEVVGIKGWCRSEYITIENIADLDKIQLHDIFKNKLIYLITQTTFDKNISLAIYKFLKAKGFL